MVVAGGGEVHHFYGAAGEAEGHGPHGGLAGPVCDLVEGRSGVRVCLINFGDVVEVGLDVTYKAYCMAPSFFSWLGSRTSRRGLPVEVSGGPSGCAGCRAVADFVVEEEMSAVEPIRSGRSVVEGLAAMMLVVVAIALRNFVDRRIDTS